MFTKENIYIGCFFTLLTFMITLLTTMAVIIFNMLGELNMFLSMFTAIRELLSNISNTQMVIIAIVSLVLSGVAIFSLIRSSN